MRPNLFDYATSELSQDAFLLWLGAWADSKNTEDNELHATAEDFISHLISMQYPDYSEKIESVSVEKQRNNIDVSYEVNNKFLIIIEDKTNTGEHGKQLERYQKIATEFCLKKNFLSPICIYFKRENECVKKINNIRQKKYYILSREKFIDILDRCGSTNPILNDYRTKLKHIEKEHNDYSILPYSKWNYRAWCGFYTSLQNEFTDAGWGYVPNPSGGFVGFFGKAIKIDNYGLYLQIEQGALCFKICEIYENRSQLRNKVSHKLLSKAKDLGYVEIKKPKRFGTGTWMTVAEVKAEDYLSENISNTIVNLKKYMGLIKFVADDLNS